MAARISSEGKREIAEIGKKYNLSPSWVKNLEDTWGEGYSAYFAGVHSFVRPVKNGSQADAWLCGYETAMVECWRAYGVKNENDRKTNRGSRN